MPDATVPLGHVEEIRREAWRMTPEIMAFARSALDDLVSIDDLLTVDALTDTERIKAIGGVLNRAIQRVGPISMNVARQRRDIVDSLIRIAQIGNLELPAELVLKVRKYRNTIKTLAGGEE